MTTLAEKVDAIRHETLDLPLSVEGSHRPCLSVWASTNDLGEPEVTLMLSALFGQQMRFVDLSPAEARKLAQSLTRVTDAIAKIQPTLTLVEGG